MIHFVICFLLDEDFIFSTTPPAITILAGTSRGCLAVDILSSDLIEGEEHLRLAIVKNTVANVRNGTASVIITNDGGWYGKHSSHKIIVPTYKLITSSKAVIIHCCDIFCSCANSAVNLRFNVSSTALVEGESAEVEVRKSGPVAFDIPFRVYAKGLIDENRTFEAGLNTPDSITVSLIITDDDIAIEPDQHYTLTLLLLEHNPQVLLTNDMANLTISDDDSEFQV